MLNRRAARILPRILWIEIRDLWDRFIFVILRGRA